MLGKGELPEVPLVVKAKYFSKDAEKKIKAIQKYIKDDSMTVADFVASYVAVLGENIQVARFGTFRLGETQDA